MFIFTSLTQAIFPMAFYPTKHASSNQQEKLLGDSGVPIPDGAGSKRSYSLKPPESCHNSEASSLGIPFSGCNFVGLVKIDCSEL